MVQHGRHVAEWARCRRVPQLCFLNNDNCLEQGMANCFTTLWVIC